MTVITISRTVTHHTRISTEDLADMLGLSEADVLQHVSEGTLTDYLDDYTEDGDDALTYGAKVSIEPWKVST